MYKESELTKLIVSVGEEALHLCIAKYFCIIVGALFGLWNQGSHTWWKLTLMGLFFLIAGFIWFGQAGADTHLNSRP